MIDYLTRVSAWLSQGVNCIILLGSEDMTVSARAYAFNWRIAMRIINALFFWQENHCRLSFLRDVAHARKVIAIHDEVTP